MSDESVGATTENGSVQVITRAAAILSALAESRGGWTIVQLADRTGLPKSTVHRICRALEQVGYVHIDETTGRRELGPGLLRLAVIGRRDLRTVLEPYLAGISDALNETVDLAVLDGGDVLFVAQHPAPRRELMAIARVGVHFPAYSMASGKVLLAPAIARRAAPAPAAQAGRHARRQAEVAAGSCCASWRRSAPQGSATNARSCGAASAPSPLPSPTLTAAPRPSPCRCPRRASRRATRTSPLRCSPCATRSRRSCEASPLREGRRGTCRPGGRTALPVTVTDARGRADAAAADVSLALLAGGRSRRMGHDKAWAPFAEATLIEWLLERVARAFPSVFIVAKDVARFRDLGVPVVADARPVESPTVGVYTALLASPSPRTLCLGCDIPFVTPALLHALARHPASFDAVVPRDDSGLQPLCALYSRRALAALEQMLDADERRIDLIFERVVTDYVDVADGRFGDPRELFLNVNTPSDLEAARRLASRLRPGRPAQVAVPPLLAHLAPDVLDFVSARRRAHRLHHGQEEIRQDDGAGRRDRGARAPGQAGRGHQARHARLRAGRRRHGHGQAAPRRGRGHRYLVALRCGADERRRRRSAAPLARRAHPRAGRPGADGGLRPPAGPQDRGLACRAQRHASSAGRTSCWASSPTSRSPAIRCRSSRWTTTWGWPTCWRDSWPASLPCGHGEGQRGRSGTVRCRFAERRARAPDGRPARPGRRRRPSKEQRHEA